MTDKRMSSGDRRLCILQAVRSLFSKKGLQVTTKELSCAAGVSEALIYKHFQSKEEMYNALLEMSCHSHDSIGMELAKLEPSTEVLACATYLLVYIKVHGIKSPEEEQGFNPNEIRGLLLQSFLSDGEFARSLFSHGLGPWVKDFVRSMKAAIKSGDMTPPQGIDLETLVWFANHSALGVKMTFQPQPPAFMGPEMTDDQLLVKLHLFLLRAIGVHQEAIDRILKTDLFKDFKKKLQNLTKENKK